MSDFDPFGDKKVLDTLLGLLKQSDSYDKFFTVFMNIYRGKTRREDAESYLDFESSLKKYIDVNPKRTADTKAKAAQYFTILNRIEYVIEVYFDNQIGIVEVVSYESHRKPKRETDVAEGSPEAEGCLFDVLKVIEARNEQEAKVGALIEEFEAKIISFFDYVKESKEGERLIVKIRSHVSEGEIYDDFAKIYRRYKARNRQTVGDFFFKETEDLVDKLCDDFEMTMRDTSG